MQPAEEVLIREWDEPEHVQFNMTSRSAALTILGSAVLGVLSIFLGIYLHDLNYYFATAVFFLIILTLLTQKKRGAPRLHIVVTDQRVVIGKGQHALADLAGFWLSRDNEQTVVNLETKKPGFLPTSFLYSTFSEGEARTTMSQVLPELEPRATTSSDQINRYFRF